MKSLTEPEQAGADRCAPPVSTPAWWSRIRVSAQGALEMFAPMGYEDADGFHLGPEPAITSVESGRP